MPVLREVPCLGSPFAVPGYVIASSARWVEISQVGASASTASSSCRRRLSASAISLLSHTSSASLPAATSPRQTPRVRQHRLHTRRTRACTHALTSSCADPTRIRAWRREPRRQTTPCQSRQRRATFTRTMQLTGCNLHPDSAAFTRTADTFLVSRPVEDCEGCPTLAGVRNLGLDDPSAGRPDLHCNFGDRRIRAGRAAAARSARPLSSRTGRLRDEILIINRKAADPHLAG